MLFVCVAESNHTVASMLKQYKFLTGLLEKLDKPEEAQKVEK